MPIPLIIGAGSGLISAALFASAATATALAGVLFYLAPLPICLAGLGWGGTAALVSALIGTVVVAASLGPATAAIFAISIAAPMVLLVHLALLSRPVATPQGQVIGALEWYPPGRLVGWAALIAGLVKSPSAYAPTISTNRAIARRNVSSRKPEPRTPVADRIRISVATNRQDKNQSQETNGQDLQD